MFAEWARSGRAARSCIVGRRAQRPHRDSLSGSRQYAGPWSGEEDPIFNVNDACSHLLLVTVLLNLILILPSTTTRFSFAPACNQRDLRG